MLSYLNHTYSPHNLFSPNSSQPPHNLFPVIELMQSDFDKVLECHSIYNQHNTCNRQQGQN